MGQSDRDGPHRLPECGAGGPEPWGFRRHATRPYLRAWLYDGSARAAPCQVPWEVAACFAPLLRWVWDGWEGTALTLAIDPTTKGRRWWPWSSASSTGAVPGRWRGTSSREARPGPWIPDLCGLRDRLGAVVPATLTVRVLCDRGLQSPRLWEAICRQRWHPYLRHDRPMTFPTATATGPRGRRGASWRRKARIR